MCPKCGSQFTKHTLVLKSKWLNGQGLIKMVNQTHDLCHRIVWLKGETLIGRGQIIVHAAKGEMDFSQLLLTKFQTP